MTSFAIALALGIGPVLALLVALISLDSYKLVRPSGIASAIGMGAAAAFASYLLNIGLIAATGIDTTTFARYVAPAIEEVGKALLIVHLIRTHRIGFLVDAAIYAFAIGTGFAVIENAWYAQALPGAGVGIWLVRGFGTAIMHGGTTALVAIAARLLADRSAAARASSGDGGGMSPIRSALIVVPGLATAIGIHSLFNHFLLNPVLSTAGILLVLPPVLFLVFTRSEASLRAWLDVGFDADTELLELIHSGDLSTSRVGLYLQSLKERFRGEVVADMLCYLRLHVELALRAKGLLMMRESGFVVELEPEIAARFAELEYLEKSIGITGRLALAPFLRASGKEIWQLAMLRR